MQRGKDFIGIGTGGIILNEQGEILLQKRRKEPEAECWSLPGGAIEYGETAENAIIREIKEETNLDCRHTLFIGYYDYILQNQTTHWISIFFLIQCDNYDAQNMEADKHSEQKWFNINKPPKHLTINTVHAINLYNNLRK